MPDPWSIGKISEEEAHQLADALIEKYSRYPTDAEGKPVRFECSHDTMVNIIVDAGLTVLGSFTRGWAADTART